MIDTYYRKACKEVIEILSYISKEEYNKIPQEIIKVLENDKDDDYNFKYDPNKTLDEQNISKQAKTIIAIFYRDYWASEYQRKKIKEYEKLLYEKIEKEKKDKYNSNEIFKIDNHIKENDRKNEIVLVDNNESLFKKILNRIKNFFTRKFNNIK